MVQEVKDTIVRKRKNDYLCRRLFWLLAGLLTVLCFSGCSIGKSSMEQYQVTYYDLFDTVTTVVGQAAREEDFRQQADAIHDALLEYHQLFDIYQEYEGIQNLKTINDHAGISPVIVDARIIALLQDCLDYYEKTEGKVNVAMGSVLTLWHDCRMAAQTEPEQAALPDGQALAEAGLHMDPQKIIIDTQASSVYLADPQMRLDVGAVAKGWAVQRVAEAWAAQQSAADSKAQSSDAYEAEQGLLISVGGNVCATGPKDEKNTPWVVGIQDPQKSDKLLRTISLSQGCVVTSGDYQRTYEVDGRSYHHIINPDTHYPSEYWKSVTVICEDSGVADMLSTALFLEDRESGQKLLERYQARAMWVDSSRNVFYSPGFEKEN